MLTFEFSFKRNWAMIWGCQPNRDKKDAIEFSVIRPSFWWSYLKFLSAYACCNSPTSSMVLCL